MTVRMMSVDAYSSMTEKTPFSVPANEVERLESVRTLVSVTSLGLPELDTLVSLVKDVFDVSTSALNIIDEDWQRVAANAGEKVSSCPRELTACTFVVESGELFVIEDLVENDFFCSMPYVTGEPRFRFYAGAPVSVDAGLTVGSCVLSIASRERFPIWNAPSLRILPTLRVDCCGCKGPTNSSATIPPLSSASH